MRRLLALALACMMALSLVACGGTADSQPTTGGQTTSGTQSASGGQTTGDNSGAGDQTLTWALWDLESTVYWRALAEGYEATHSGVKIDIIDLGSTDYMTSLATQLAGGNGELDVLSIKDIPGYANLINLQVLEPMNNNLTVPKEDFGGVLEQLTDSNGDFYAVPFRADFWVVFYNKDLFDAAGVPYPTNDMTMEDFDALIKKMTSGTGADKVYGNHYHTWRSAVSLFGILDGKHSIVDGTYDFLKPIYEMVLDEQNGGYVMDYGEAKTSGAHYSGVFENGQAAMVNMGSWFLATLYNYNNEAAANGVKPVNFGMVKYPHPAGVKAGTTLGTVTSLAVNASSEKKELAIDFVNWCAGPEGAKIMAESGNFPAVSTGDVVSIISSDPNFPDDAASLEAMSTTAVYLEMPLSDKASEIETVLNTHHDAIMTGAETVDEGISAMNVEVSAILNG